MPNERLTLEILTQATGQDSVDRLTTAMNRFATASEAAANKTTTAFKGVSTAADGTGASMRRLFLAVKDLGEGRRGFATVEAGYFIQSLGGVATMAVGTAAAIGVLAVGLEKLRDKGKRSAEEISGAMAALNDPIRQSNDQLRLANDQLENQIAKLQGRPQNNLKIALDEALVSADKLAESMAKATSGLFELINKRGTGKWEQFLPFGGPTTDPIQKLVGGDTGYGGLEGTIREITRRGKAGISSATTETDKDTATKSMNAELTGAYDAAIQKLRGMQTDAEKKRIEEMRRGSSWSVQDKFIETATATRENLEDQKSEIGLRSQNAADEAANKRAEADKAAQEAARQAIARSAQQFAFSDDAAMELMSSRGKLNTNNKIGFWEDRKDAESDSPERAKEINTKLTALYQERAEKFQQMLRHGQEAEDRDAKKAQEWQRRLEEIVNEGDKSVGEARAREAKRIADIQDSLAKETTTGRVKGITTSGSFAGRSIESSALLTERQKIAALYKSDLDTANAIYQVELSGASVLIDQKAREDATAKAQVDHEDALQKIKEDNVLRLGELQNKQAQEFSATLVEGFNAVTARFGREQQTKQFLEGLVRSQLDTVVGNAAKALFDNPTFKNAKNNIGFSSGPLAKVFKGTMLDGSSKNLPLDANTTALRALTTAIETAQKSALSPSGGGSAGGWGGSGWGMPSGLGLPGSSPGTGDVIPAADWAAFTSGGPASSDALSAQMVKMQSADSLGGSLGITNTPSSMSPLASNVAMGVTAGLGVFAAAKDFTKGNASGIVGGVGALAGTAGALVALAGVTGPAAPILAGIGATLGIIGSFLGTGPQLRAQQITSTLQAGQYIAPTALNVTQSSGGTFADFDARGNLRTSNFSPYPQVTQGFVWAQTHGFLGGPPTYYNVPGGQTSQFGAPVATPPPVQHIYHIQAMDIQSFHEFAQKNSHAIGEAAGKNLQNVHGTLANEVGNIATGGRR